MIDFSVIDTILALSFGCEPTDAHARALNIIMKKSLYVSRERGSAAILLADRYIFSDTRL